MKKFVLLGCVCGLSACGGGGGQIDASYKTLRVFSDSSGVAVGTGSDGSKALVLMPEISAVVTEINSTSDTSDTELNLEDFPVVGNTERSTIRQGAVTEDGLTQNFLIYEIDGEQGFGLVTLPEYDMKYLLVSGSEMIGNPSGAFTYTGDQIVEAWQSGAFREVGTVTIGANFDTNSFTYSGETANSSLTGTGILEVDQGRFTDIDATLIVSGQSYETTIHGLVNGNVAETATGVFHTNDSTPDYVGAFVAKKN